MSSSDDDMPLSRGRRATGNKSAQSAEKIPKSLDRALDREVPSGHGVAPAVSLRNGPADAMDIDEPHVHEAMTNGTSSGKRKAASKPKVSKATESSDEPDEIPLKRQRTSAARAKTRQVVESSDSDDEPIRSKRSATKRMIAQAKSNGTAAKAKQAEVAELRSEKAAIEKRAEKQAKAIRESERTKNPPKSTGRGAPAKKKQKQSADDDDEEESKPTAKRSRLSQGAASASKKGTSTKQSPPADDSDSDEKPLRHKAPARGGSTKDKTKAKAADPKKSSAKGKATVKKEEVDEDVEAEEGDEEEYRWWEDPAKGDGTKKWNTLQHSGVVFPPPYEPLPAQVKMHYDGMPVTLKPEAEEVAGFFGAMLNSTHNVENPTFQKNFFEDFQDIVASSGGALDRNGQKIKILEFARCDFTLIFDHYEAQKAERKVLPAAEKKRLKAEKDAVEAPYMHCLWDGRKEKVGNFRIEPPGLFRGRGEHPKTGRVKKRIRPEQITINIGKDATVPAPPHGHRWKEIRHDQTGTWLAMWQENINNAYKYVMLAATSAVKGQSDYNKFEKARELKKHIDRIRQDYRKNLKAELMADRQKATAVYLIDQLALRAGNEKGEDEADTVGCCSLKFEHVTLKPPNIVIFDFLGKDSIRFYNEVPVDEQVFKNLKIFKKAPKGEGDEIFDRLKTNQLNQHLSSYMPGLTAKVFRTYNASFTMSEELKKMKPEGSIGDKIKDYNEANRRVAILCNHKRTVPASHEGQMEKLSDKIKGLQYQKWRVKQMMLDIEPGLKKKRGPEAFELPPDLDEAWIVQHQAALVEEQRQKIEKKFHKENEKRLAEGEREMKAAELTERLQVADDLAKQFQKENKTKKVTADGRGATIERMEANLEKLDGRIEAMNTQAEVRENTKEVALGTSKINYIDPRLTVVFSKKFGVPIDRFFSKSLREKFDWAIKSVEEDWQF